MSGRTLMNGRYELEALPVAKGGMGEVWFGRDTRLDREIAVKFIRIADDSPDRDYVRRFVRESRITARLEHPGVPAVYDAGDENGRPFLVMQRIRGISVADLSAEYGPLPIGWAAAIAAQVCSVLSAAHQAALVHRDLKPSNLMLEPNGAVKVLDFGLAVAPTLTDFSTITHSSHPPGTLAYMAPEQIEANLASPASDLYSLGCTLHEMLCGERPFSGSTSYSLMIKHVHEPPPALRELRADAPVELERLVLDLLKKKPEDRPANAGIVYQRLLPFVRDLEPLPGALNPPAQGNPVRMYAGVLSRVFPDAPPAAPPTVPAPPAPPPSPRLPDLNRAELQRARSEASHLARQSRYNQAAEVLNLAIGPASRTVGGTDTDVIELRLDLANVLFDGGDYLAAAPAYAALASDLTDRNSPGDDRVLHCRMREATCHALIGEISLALRKLTSLLRDQQRFLGDDDPRTLELRRQIGLLQLGAGQRHAAKQTLSHLLTDLGRLHNDPNHPATAEVSDLLKGLPHD